MQKIIISFLLIKGRSLKQEILIDIYSDTICPWCYIGLNKLKLAILEFPSINFKLTWRPFQLNPNMPKKGMNRQEYLETKFNGKKSAEEVYKSIYHEGIKNNIHFQFQKIKYTPNSFASHKLLALAYKFNKQTEVVESLFYDYFIEGIDIGNHKELIRISKSHNIHNSQTLDYLTSEEDAKSLLSEEKHARELGIKGVPCFIINKEFVVFGAQEHKNFIDIFKKTQNDN